MEIAIDGKRENLLLNRVEVDFTVAHVAEPTPKRDQVREELAKLLKVTKDRVVVDHMESSFGKGESAGYAKIYKSKDEAVRLECDYVLVRNGLAQKKETKADEKKKK
ncbi:MAG: 30S ribosomal protein S24e [Methanobacteriota archaeon]